MPALDAVLSEKTAALQAANRWRNLRAIARDGVNVSLEDKQYISFSCNDYFCLTNHESILAAAQEATEDYGLGAGASRLVTGNHPLHGELAAELAKSKATEAATLFGSGYLANIGTIPALVGKGDLILADKLSHACMLDAAALSGAKLLRFKHNDAGHAAELLAANRAEYGHCLILTETIFSMDGDRAPLPALFALAEQHDAWLMTDDAHGFALVKDNPAHIQMGTLSKGLASYGGYVAGSQTLIHYLESTARSLVYSTALPPACLAAALEALRILKADAKRVARPMALAQRFTAGLGLPEAQSPIVPLVLGPETAALDAAAALRKKGFLVTAIRPPTVLEGTARLRFSFSSAHSDAQVDALIAAVKEIADVHART